MSSKSLIIDDDPTFYRQVTDQQELIFKDEKCIIVKIM